MVQALAAFMRRRRRPHGGRRNRSMIRPLVLLVAVFMLAAQKGDGKPSARASICTNKECSRTSGQGFEPATIRVTYAVPKHQDNRLAEFALFCSSGAEHRSRWQLDGEKEVIPTWIVTYRDIWAGECQAVITVLRSDGSILEGKSQAVRVLAVLD
jgi:hypothetical protein